MSAPSMALWRLHCGHSTLSRHKGSRQSVQEMVSMPIQAERLNEWTCPRSADLLDQVWISFSGDDNKSALEHIESFSVLAAGIPVLTMPGYAIGQRDGGAVKGGYISVPIPPLMLSAMALCVVTFQLRMRGDTTFPTGTLHLSQRYVQNQDQEHFTIPFNQFRSAVYADTWETKQAESGEEKFNLRSLSACNLSQVMVAFSRPDGSFLNGAPAPFVEMSLETSEGVLRRGSANFTRVLDKLSFDLPLRPPGQIADVYTLTFDRPVQCPTFQELVYENPHPTPFYTSTVDAMGDQVFLCVRWRGPERPAGLAVHVSVCSVNILLVQNGMCAAAFCH